jgi:hypothetical protein
MRSINLEVNSSAERSLTLLSLADPKSRRRLPERATNLPWNLTIA